MEDTTTNKLDAIMQYLGKFETIFVQQQESIAELKTNVVQLKSSFVQQQESIAELKSNFVQQQESIAELKSNFVQQQESIAELQLTQKENYISLNSQLGYICEVTVRPAIQRKYGDRYASAFVIGNLYGLARLVAQKERFLPHDVDAQIKHVTKLRNYIFVCFLFFVNCF